MKFLVDFLKGIIIGVGAVAPGVSGGAFAVMLGVYHKLTDAIGNIFKDFRRKVFFLFPLGLGICVGVLAFSNVMKYLFKYYNSQVKLLFIGLMIGTLPSIFHEANKYGFKKSYLVPSIVTFIIAILFTFMGNSVIDIVPEENPSLLALMIYGVIIGFGTIVPGISSSFILMYIGAYEILLDGISSMNLMILIPTGIGFIISIMIFASLINYLFEKIYGYTYYTVIGFVLGSIFAIFPAIDLNIDFIFGIVFCILGALISYTLSRIKISS